MKIARYNRGYTIRASEREMRILRHMDSLTDKKALRELLGPSDRKSLGRRLAGGPFLRTDEDRRS